MTTTAKDIHDAFGQKFSYQVVTSKEKPDQLRIVGRILPDKDGRNVNNYLLVAHRLLKAAFKRPWDVDISKWYFMKSEDAPMVFGFRFIFQADKLDQHYADIVNLIKTAPATARAEVTEMPLVGSSIHRNSTAGGRRGAGPMGTVPVGPAAAYSKNMGG
jgi:hypothetical protein